MQRKARTLPVFLLPLLLLISIQNHAQEKINLSEKNARLDKVFENVQKQTAFNIWFDKTVLEKTTPVDIELKDASLTEAIERCVRNQPLEFSIVGKNVVIKEKKHNPPADTSTRIDISGKLLNEKGEPLAGVSITVNNKVKGTMSGADGSFFLPAVEPGALLIFSGTNVETYELRTSKRKEISVVLKTRTNKLDEVQIIAYGTTTRRTATGSYVKINSEEIERQPVTNVLGALEGNVAGLSISQSNGVPGSGYIVLIRGQNSLANGNDPYYIVDGVPFSSTPLVSSATSSVIIPSSSPLGLISPQDIESITILKDADATAIYGSKGSNGVILIATKKGKPGKTKFDLNVYTGTGEVTRTMPFLNTTDYLTMRHEAFNNDQATPQAYDYDVNGVFDTTRYTNWTKTLIGGHSSITNVNGSVSGGNAQTQFFFGGGYHRETPVFTGDFADTKGSAHLQINHVSPDEKFSFNVSVNYLHETNNLPSQDLTSQVMNLPPDAPAVYDSTGKLNWQNGAFNNPFAYLFQPYHIVTSNLVSGANLTYQIFKDLHLKVGLGYNEVSMDETEVYPLTSFWPGNGLISGFSTFARNNLITWNIEPQILYKTNISKGVLQLMAGSTFQNNTSESQTLTASGFSSDVLLENIAAATTVTVLQNNANLYHYNAFFARINYNFDEKYVLNLSARRDGSSRFGPGKQFANFGAVGLAWIFTKEAFTSDLTRILSFGKLRGSYGITGNDKIGDYQYLNSYVPSALPYDGHPGLYPARLSNPDYSWETTKKADLGLDLGLFNNRILLTVDYFLDRSSNQLVGYPLSMVTGFSSVQANLKATLQNSGWEFELSAMNIQRGHFSWITKINLTIPSSKLISFPNIEASPYAYRYAVGHTLDTKILFHSTGVDPASGVYQFQSAGAINNLSTINPSYPQDLMAVKRVGRSYYGGVENSINYKKWQIVFLFQFVKQTGYNYIATSSNAPGFYGNQPNYVIARWQNPGDQKAVQRFTQDYSSASYNSFSNSEYLGDNGIGDASFIRLKNLAFSYQFGHLRLFVQGQNLITITSYQGVDPETQYNSSLPPLKVWTAGLQLNL